MSTTQKFRWNHIAIEGITIVASILLAFAIDAWWDDRSERVRLVAAIQNIVAEVSEAREEINSAVQRNQFRIDGMRQFLSLSPDELATLPRDTVVAISRSFVIPSPFDPGEIALQGFLTGGNLEKIADRELANALIAWAQFPNEIDDDHEDVSVMMIAVFERAAGHGVWSAILNEEADPKIPGGTDLQDALVALRRDNYFVDLLANSITYFESFARQLADGIEIADQVLEASKQ